MTQFTELALKAAECKQNRAAAQGDAVMRPLAPFITQTARRVHASRNMLRRQNAYDFVTESPSLVWNRIDKFHAWFSKLDEPVRNDPSKDLFLAWCYQELHFRYLDWGRQQTRNVQTYLLGNEAIPDKSVTSPNDPEPEVRPMDLQRLLDGSAIDGIILCCLTGQWELVPTAVWKSWLAELGLPESFPPAAFVSANLTERRHMLMTELRISQDNLYQRWHRLKLKFQAEPVTAEA